MRLADPAHTELGLVDLASRSEQYRFLGWCEQRPIQRSRLSGNELGAQPSQVADVLVFPDENCIDSGIG
jgi:hypothetical protein